MSRQRHFPRFTREEHGLAGDDRLESPTFLRNAPPIIATLSAYLRDRTGPVLEIGAGTGQHAAAFALAFPSIDWIASDPLATHRDSIEAWAKALLDAPRAPIALDAAGDWSRLPEVAALGPLTGIYAGNVTHIAPWAVTEGVLTGAAAALAPSGRLFLYGPFREGDEFFGDGNRRFDQALRADDPHWGLRDIDALRLAARARHLRLETVHPMPANNHLLVFRRSSS
ncbi:DUF938 domain-containing protein [Tropicimonas sp. IMCC34043]|uniref:DUF938 domain-containing protein n=1 Tax=Tropicimonas sp. IMCC34043 TaxID=2248760 RepID=UPI000E26C19F|nr:DUF938 domain-containing protein [Tropicimonas sp. IMCC34043]